MHEPVTTMKQHQTHVETINDPDQLQAWRETAFTAALQKYKANHDNIETILQTGEAFGRAIHSAHLTRTDEWNLDDWCTEASRLLAPLGDAFSVTHAQSDVVATFLRRNPLTHQHHNDPLDALFTYGTLRGLFRSAFPDGELVLTRPTTTDTPASLYFKLHPSSLDRLTRERVKESISVMNRHDTP